RPGADAAAEDEDGDVLARVIAAGPRGIAAMVRTEYEDVVGRETAKELGEATVEVFECRCVPLDVATVSVQHVEVDEVGEDDRAIRSRFQCGQGALKQRRVACG